MINTLFKNTLFGFFLLNSFELQAAVLPFGNTVKTEIIALHGDTLAAQAVPKEKFVEGLKDDCRDFHLRLQKWSDQKVQISDEVYRELRSMPSAFSMLEKFQVDVHIPKEGSLTSAMPIAEKLTFNVSKENPEIIFSAKSFTPEKYRGLAENEIEIQLNSTVGESVAIFQSRDVFCDILFGYAQINLTGELFMKPEENFQKSLVEKLKIYAEAFNIANKKDKSENSRAVLFGAALYSLSGDKDFNIFQNELLQNSDLFLKSGKLVPNENWFATVDKRVDVRDLTQIYLGMNNIQFLIGN